MQEKQPKSNRTLSIYARLCEGHPIIKAEEALRFGVDERSVQRDIDYIRSFLSEQAACGTADYRKSVYDRKKKGFVMEGGRSSMMTNSEILAVSNVLLDSRAFGKKEISGILDKMISGCAPEQDNKCCRICLQRSKLEKYGILDEGNNCKTARLLRL